MKHCLSFAVNGEGHVVSIHEVANGLACNCTCPGCGAQLIAKKYGKKRVEHFAHESGSECSAGYESALHLAVKTILARIRRLRLPDCFVKHVPEERQVFVDDKLRTVTELVVSYPKHDLRSLFESPAKFDREYPSSGCAKVLGSLVVFDQVSVESREGSVVPDLIGHIGDRRLFIEVAVTHFVDEHKLAKLKALDVATIELDFSTDDHRALDWAALEDRLTNSFEGKRWLWNPKANALANRDRLAREQRTVGLRAMLAKREVSHESMFDTAGGGGMRVALCPSYVIVSGYGHRLYTRDQMDFDRWLKSAKAVRHEPSGAWHLLPATEDHWVKVEGLLRSRFMDKNHGSWIMRKRPEGHEERLSDLMRTTPAWPLSVLPSG